MVVCNLHTVCGNLTRVVIISHFRAYLMTIFKALLELNAENSLAWSSSCKTSLSKEKKNRETPNFRTSVPPLFKSIELLPPFPANSLKIIWDILPVVIRLQNRCTFVYTYYGNTGC